jgi:hypothetical protein
MTAPKTDSRPSPGPFYTVQQIAERHPAFTVRTLRHWIFKAEDRSSGRGERRIVLPGNGFSQVIVRKGRRVFIDEAALFEWLQGGESAAAGQQARRGSDRRADS